MLASGEVEVQPGWGRFPAINLVLPIHQLKQIRSRAKDAFRAPQYKECSWLQSIMKDGHDPFLQSKPEVDQHIAATDNVYARKWRALWKGVTSENKKIAACLVWWFSHTPLRA